MAWHHEGLRASGFPEVNRFIYVAARRVQVHSDEMDNAVIYGFWAVGSFAILGAALAFLVW
jgi:hypothetical protein